MEVLGYLVTGRSWSRGGRGRRRGGGRAAARGVLRRRRLDLRGRLVQPPLVLGRRLDDHPRAHDPVAHAAELRADDLVGAELVRVEDDVRRDPGDDVLLHPELDHVEVVDHVLRAHLQLDLLAQRDVEVARSDLAAGVVELPRELLGRDADDDAVLGEGLVVREHQVGPDGDDRQEDRRHDGPDDLEGGVAVGRGPVALVAGLGAEAEGAVDDDGRDEREDHDRRPDHEPHQLIDAVGLLGRLGRQPVDSEGHGRRRDHR